MSTIILGFHYDIGKGNRSVYEDRVKVVSFVTAGGVDLSVAVVADGVGGRDAGERAAQLAVDTVLTELMGSTETAVPHLLSHAAQRANQVVCRESVTQPDKYWGSSTTLAIAAVENGNRLFIANVGDSRIYLCRGTKLSQLTLDHTFANMMPLEGRLSWAAARENPNAEAVMRALGLRPDMPIDIGFYVNTIDPHQAHLRGQKGIPLKKGDTILVCSDGLTKTDPAGQPYTLDEEILQVVHSQEGNKAAKTLVAFALGRDTDDNVSVALLQTSDPDRMARVQQASRRPKMIIMGVLALAVFLVAGVSTFFVGKIRTTTAEVVAVAQHATTIVESTQTAWRYEQTAIAATEAAIPTSSPSPTSRPRPASEQGQIALVYTTAVDQPIPLLSFSPIVEAAEPVEILINHTGDTSFEEGHVYAAGGSWLEFERVAQDGVEIEVEPGSDIFVQTGGYENGVTIDLNRASYSFSVAGSCMSVAYVDAQTAVVACYEGTCRYQVTGHREQPQIFAGNFVVFSLNDLTGIEVEQAPINLSFVSQYEALFPDSHSGVANKQHCLASYIPPTATPAPIIIPSLTPHLVDTLIPPTTTIPLENRKGAGGENRATETSGPLVRAEPTALATHPTVTTEPVNVPTSLPTTVAGSKASTRVGSEPATVQTINPPMPEPAGH